MSETRQFVRWADIEQSAAPLFSISSDRTELQWARAAWDAVERAGLTRAGDEIERAVVMVRLLAVAALYHGFARAAWGEGDLVPQEWARELEVRRTRLLQSLDSAAAPDDELDDEELLALAFDAVFEAEYAQVKKVLFGSLKNESLLFAWLWLARDPDWSGRTDMSREILDEVLSDCTADNGAAFEWLGNGASLSDL